MKILLLVLLLVIPVLAQNDAQGPCYDERGNEARCSDGKFHDHNGRVQPDTCNNNYQNADKCQCAKATTTLENCPENNLQMDMSKCQVWCRDDACECVTVCDNNDGN